MNLGNPTSAHNRLYIMKRIGLVLAVLTMGAAACGGATTATTTSPPNESQEQLGRLTAARQLWSEAAPADYTVTHVDMSDELSPERQTVAVRDGKVVSLAGEPTSVEHAFDGIEESIRQGAEVAVEYDPQFGYPARVDIDHDGDGVFEIQSEYRDLTTMPIVRTLAELRTAQQRWEAQQLDSYRYIFRFDCTCPESGTYRLRISRSRRE